MKTLFVLAVLLAFITAVQPSPAQEGEPAQPVDTAMQQAEEVQPADTAMRPESEETTPPESAFTVDEIMCGTAIVERELEGVSKTFPAGTEKVFCWTLITGGEEPATVEHVWYYGAEVIARVPLEINYPRVRTWSSKTMLPEWIGAWKVELVDEGGNVLAATEFTIE